MKKGKRRLALWLLLFLLLPAALAFGARSASRYTGPDAGELTALLCRAAATCYAAEGRYPPDLDYLTKAYGVSYNPKKFHVFYQLDGANLTPDITVVPAEEATK
ncbi:hypothetical protein NE562_15445 [Butyricicoccus faecihominis]|uniref:hypothetical protein n=1 Tax=Butyricicoccus faecihominis TaxID=1712515 RepID=UPI00247A613D|nr:hypothetical protein [Butyricicoccus faecihominis]MCQ5131059.1 hypothetical protein [Butyricicoccus faecihominis]